jgi:hypothetical protein
MSDLRLFQRAFVIGLSGTSAAVTPMSVHRNTALLGAVEALGDNFPVVRAILGEQAFEALAIDHARAFPPDSPVLAHYGRHFPAWLADQALAHELPYLVEVAECERLWVEALHAADAPALELSDLQEILIDELLQLPLKLHPAARFAWQATPAIAIWLAHQKDSPSEIAPDWRCAGALFTRPRLSVAGREIDAAAHRLLSGIAQGESLGQAAAAASSLPPDADIGSCLAGLVQCGALAALS